MSAGNISNPIRRAVKAVLLAMLAIVLIAVFFIAVVMGQPQEEQSARTQVRTNQVLLPALSAPILYGTEEELASMRGAFPAPWLTPQYASMMTFRGAVLESVPFENGHGRILTLTYLLDSSETVTIASIYPARALELMGSRITPYPARLDRRWAACAPYAWRMAAISGSMPRVRRPSTLLPCPRWTAPCCGS